MMKLIKYFCIFLCFKRNKVFIIDEDLTRLANGVKEVRKMDRWARVETYTDYKKLLYNLNLSASRHDFYNVGVVHKTSEIKNDVVIDIIEKTQPRIKIIEYENSDSMVRELHRI